jgi:hypothetical protein
VSLACVWETNSGDEWAAIGTFADGLRPKGPSPLPSQTFILESITEGLEVATMMWWHWGSSSWFTMWILMGVSFGGLALLIVLALRTESAPQTRRQPNDESVANPREVLGLELLRGEIDAAHYLDEMNALSEAHDA